MGAVLHWVETAVRVHDSTTCTSKDNTWLMPTPTQSIPYLKLSEIDFSAPKRKKVDLAPSSAPVPVRKSIAPSTEQEKIPIILSIVEPYSENFIHHRDHVPQLLYDIFKPVHLEYNYTQLLTLANDYAQVKVIPAMVSCLAQMIRDQNSGFNIELEESLPLDLGRYFIQPSPLKVFAILKLTGLAPKLLHGVVNTRRRHF